MVRHLLPLVALTLGLGGWVLHPSIALAQEPAILIFTNAPLRLLVDGLETEKLPVAIRQGSRVCVVSAQHYTSEAERWVFQGWSHGSTAECVTLTEPGVYRAVYTHQVLLHIRSSVNQLQRSIWVEQGSPVDVTVPSLLEEGERVRYRFQVWSDGETPILPANRIAPLKPMTLEAKFAKEYLVGVEGPALSGAEGAQGASLPGSGWYAEGASLVLQAPDVIAGQAATDRLKFARWETVGSPFLLIPDAAKPALTVKVDAPYTIKAVYVPEFLVVITVPGGELLRKWYKAGDEFSVESPTAIETIPGQARLVFKRWEGLPSVAAPSIQGTVGGPIALRAVYERQVMVTVVTPWSAPPGGAAPSAEGQPAAAPQAAPYGPAAGGGWQTPGTTVTVSVPGSAQSKLVFIRRFEGFAGYASGKSSIQVLVTEPITITAIYSSGVNMLLLGLFLAPFWLALLYVVSRWVVRLAPRRRSVD